MTTDERIYAAPIYVVLENWVSESKQKRREKYREQEKIVRDTQ